MFYKGYFIRGMVLCLIPCSRPPLLPQLHKDPQVWWISLHIMRCIICKSHWCIDFTVTRPTCTMYLPCGRCCIASSSTAAISCGRIHQGLHKEAPAYNGTLLGGLYDELYVWHTIAEQDESMIDIKFYSFVSVILWVLSNICLSLRCKYLLRYQYTKILFVSFSVK